MASQFEAAIATTPMKITKVPLVMSCCLWMSLLYPDNANAMGRQSLVQANLRSTDPNTVIELQQVASTKLGAALLALDLEGLRVVNSSTGSTRALSFGMKEDEVVSTLTNLRGKPRSRGVNKECGAGALGYASWTDRLTLWFNKSRFVGWFIDDRHKDASKLMTISGIGVGSSRRKLNSVYTVKISQTSLGTEFMAGKLGGLLSGTQPDARVTSLLGGTTCLFR